MKNVIFTLSLLMALTMSVGASAQQQRQDARTQEELVDSASKNVIEVYSDTTSTTDSLGRTTSSTKTTVTWNNKHIDDDWGPFAIFKTLDNGAAQSMIFVLLVMLIIFVLAPVLIIIAVFYFINKNRKEKMRLAQMAVQQGQPIPDQLLDDKGTVSDEYQKGLRQCFVGVGLMIFLGLTAEEIGFGIGALVFCIGLGKIVAAKMAEKKSL